MGLASVFGIVKAHDGAVDLTSVEGGGTAVTIYLPLLDGERPEKGTEHEPVSTLSKMAAGGKRILMVDDQPMILETGVAMLERLGYQATGAEGGKAAIEMISESPDGFDLVILDMIMPEMNGEQTFGKIMEINPGIPVLLCSGYSRDQQADAVLERGARGYLQKPFNLDQLSRAVTQAMEKKISTTKSPDPSGAETSNRPLSP